MSTDQSMDDDHLEILYRDDDVVAINKPTGLLVHRTQIDPHDNRNAMHLLRNQLGQWVYPVHRLDKPTSGVLLFAFNERAARAISEQFEQGLVQKTYLAVVRGFIAGSGQIDHPLVPIDVFQSRKKRRQKGEVQKKAAQSAQTYYECLASVELPFAVDKYPTSRYSLVKLMPKTGRKHQLRRHMKHLSHPIIGDPKYGKSTHNQFFKSHFHCSRLLLAATSLEFTQPSTGEIIVVNSALDNMFEGVLTAFDLENQMQSEGIL